MKCLCCTTDLPVDGNKPKITCPKCGSEFDVKLNKHAVSSTGQPLYYITEPPIYGEDERFNNPTNY